MKKCPYCAEEIQDDAVRCRFCRAVLKKRNGCLGCLMGCFLAILISFTALALLTALSVVFLKWMAHRMLSGGESFYYYYYGGHEGFLDNFTDFLRLFFERIHNFFNPSIPKYI